jgi:hypothetical protein
MQNYLNLNGDSGISRYENGNNFIKVEFSDGSVYLYDYSAPGQSQVEDMKRLAKEGRGLNSYIGKFVRRNYAAKLI